MAHVSIERGWSVGIILLTMHKDEALFQTAIVLRVRGFVIVLRLLAEERYQCTSLSSR